MELLAHDPEALSHRMELLRQANVHLREELAREGARFVRTPVRRTERAILPDAGLEELTPREHEVLRLIAEGSSTRDVAQRLGISFKTAACHRHRLMQKLDVHATGSLVRFAIASGIVEL
jgi:DNA-binding NarL/FixJ family response regulator